MELWTSCCLRSTLLPSQHKKAQLQAKVYPANIASFTFAGLACCNNNVVCFSLLVRFEWRLMH